MNEAIQLSLVSHTNVGKTTLMRTLLRRDVGEVADRAHVTELSEAHPLVETPDGDVLRLWDTPGFGDSARLLKRLRVSANPIGWLLTQVWDRFTDRPFFSSQQAIRNVRDESDVVLYLVNASEDPASAGYVDAEMQILGWIGKPVLVLLNQVGPAQDADAARRDEDAWSKQLAPHVASRGAIALDAFARCWVQEDRLLGAVRELLPETKAAAFDRLRAAWRVRNVETFDASMRALADDLAAVATSTAPPEPTSDAGMEKLAKEADRLTRESTDQLIALHGLSGKAKDQILARLEDHFDVARPADVAKAGVLGGLVTGALGGLAADLSLGGITLGAGAIVGGILGALGATSAARAYNLMQGNDRALVRWSKDFLRTRPAAALLRYLAVAHHSRGRGDWTHEPYPAHWRGVVEDVVRARAELLEPLWAMAGQGATREELSTRLRPLVRDAGRELLERLYPEARAIFNTNDPGDRHEHAH